MSSDFEIAPLADRLVHLPTVATWLREEFGRDVDDAAQMRDAAGGEGAGWETRVRGFLGRDAAPIIWLALAGAEAAGTVTLVDDLVPDLPPYVPRLAFLYVAPPYRRRGLGAALTRHVERQAALLGHRRLYLYATDQERLYARLGWSVVERGSFHGESMAVMAIDLRRPASGEG